MNQHTLTTHDNLTLTLGIWESERAKGIVLIAHGLGEHIARYDYVAQKLNQAGYHVLGIDHRAHGKSQGDPRGAVDNLTQLVDDFELLLEYAQNQFPNLPIFVLGHSMGGAIATQFTLRHQTQLAGLITSGAALMLRAYPPSALKMMAGLFHLLPNLPLIAPIDINQLTHHPEIREATQNDPLYFKERYGVRTVGAIQSAGLDALNRVQKLTLPILILHGAEDSIVAPQSSQHFYQRVGSQDKTLEIYPGLYHEILNETQRDTIIATIIDWLDQHLSSTMEPGK